jgi:hypothetical protein
MLRLFGNSEGKETHLKVIKGSLAADKLSCAAETCSFLAASPDTTLLSQKFVKNMILNQLSLTTDASPKKLQFWF